MKLVHRINRMSNSAKLITYTFEKATIIRHRLISFFNLTKIVTQILNTLNRGIAKGIFKSNPHFTGCR
ncbi:hypothetical protein HanRHA438_Chr04g0181091 [Helianthus annuus]|nr:hypothetical protein HanRHA438_Chr04g0181091 [Helianthus annuus]